MLGPGIGGGSEGDGAAFGVVGAVADGADFGAGGAAEVFVGGTEALLDAVAGVALAGVPAEGGLSLVSSTPAATGLVAGPAW